MKRLKLEACLLASAMDLLASPYFTLETIALILPNNTRSSTYTPDSISSDQTTAPQHRPHAHSNPQCSPNLALLSLTSISSSSPPRYVIQHSSPTSISLAAVKTHSLPTLSAALTAWLNLLIASVRARPRVPWEAVVAGVASMAFVALYPLVLERTHKALIARQVRSGDVLTGFSPPRGSSGAAATASVESGSKQAKYVALLR